MLYLAFLNGKTVHNKTKFIGLTLCEPTSGDIPLNIAVSPLTYIGLELGAAPASISLPYMFRGQLTIGHLMSLAHP